MSTRYSRLLVAGCAVAIAVPVALASRPSDAQAAGAPVPAQAHDILKRRCFQCHGENGVALKNIFVLDQARLIQAKIVVAGDLNSPLLRAVETGAMPQGDKRLPDDEIATLREWVRKGAPDWATGEKTAPRAFLTEAEILHLITTDLEKQNERSRKFLRYYSIAHLYNADISDAELEGYRIGLTKLLNSLSWHREISKAEPIDPAKTILRIDLRDFDWVSEKSNAWKTVLAAYPYGVRTAASVRIKELSEAELPYVRADWFVATASVPPLYHQILGLPDTVQELERRLEVNAERDLEQEKNVARAGFSRSGVSRNNRVVERHFSRDGAYWKSFDFSSNQGEQNIFADPLHFKAAGGEMIFSLPNGMQGYFLAKADGTRLDQGPTNIVFDRNNPDDPIVTNGRSCMSCHYAGVKTFNDDVRAAVKAVAQATFDREKTLAIYLEQSRLNELLQQDSARFQHAIEVAGGKISADHRTEPVYAISQRYNSELTLGQASAEVGLRPDEFKRMVPGSNLNAALSPLVSAGGAVKRDAWEEQFGPIIRELKLGYYVTTKENAARSSSVKDQDKVPENPMSSKTKNPIVAQPVQNIASVLVETVPPGATIRINGMEVPNKVSPANIRLRIRPEGENVTVEAYLVLNTAVVVRKKVIFIKPNDASSVELYFE